MSLFLINPDNQDFEAKRDAFVTLIQKRFSRYVMLVVALTLIVIMLLWIVMIANGAGRELITYTVLIVVMAGALIFIQSQQRDKVLWTYRDGQILDGKLTSIQGRIQGSNFVVDAAYEAQDFMGDNLKGRAQFIRNDLRNQLLPPVGTPVQILYVDKKQHFMM